MRYIKLSLPIIICLCFTSGFAQQSPFFGYTSQLLPVSNPSLSKDLDPLKVVLAGRKYWTGIPESPEAVIGTFGISPLEHKSAIGGYVWSEKAPLISKQIIGINYAYGINKIAEEVNLRLGFGIDFISVSSNNSNVLVSDYNDPYYTALFSNNHSAADIRLGAAVNLSQLEIGMGFQQVIKSKNRIGETTEGDLNFKNASSVSGHLKYDIKPSAGTVITPLIYWQTQKGVPLRMDLNLMAEKTGKLYGGLWVRPNSAIGTMVGFWILPEVKLGYLYEKSFFKGISNSGRSHELLITYTPIRKSGEKEEKKIKEVLSNGPDTRLRDTVVIVKETVLKEPDTPKDAEAKDTLMAKNENETTLKEKEPLKPEKEKPVTETKKEKKVIPHEEEPKPIPNEDTVIRITNKPEVRKDTVIKKPSIPVVKKDTLKTLTKKPTENNDSITIKKAEEKILPKTYFYVITGLYGVKANADKLCRKLELEGYKTQLVMKKGANQYYVTVGKFETEDEAQEFINKKGSPKYTFWIKEIEP